MDFYAQLKKKAEITDHGLEALLPKQAQFPPIIFEAMRYSLFAGGKRLRPVILFSACELFGGSVSQALPFGCALEMIHTYSLIHDDLPAMDNDDYRRGRLTSHKKFGEDLAILAGDALLHHAMEVMADACAAEPSAKNVKAMQAVAHGAGIFGMLSGQVVDICSEGKEIDANTLQFIHINKTAALIKAACKAGAYLGGAEEEQACLLGDAGEKIGVAFQIQDDILDVTGTQEELGKPIGSDEKNKKATYVAMHGMEKSRAEVEKLSAEAVNILEAYGVNAGFLVSLTKFLTHRTS